MGRQVAGILGIGGGEVTSKCQYLIVGSFVGPGNGFAPIDAQLSFFSKHGRPAGGAKHRGRCGVPDRGLTRRLSSAETFSNFRYKGLLYSCREKEFGACLRSHDWLFNLGQRLWAESVPV